MQQGRLADPARPAQDRARRLSQRKYRAGKGQICPFCRSDGPVQGTGGVETDLVGANQEVSCAQCGAHWLDLYDLAGYQLLEGGDNPASEPSAPTTKKPASPEPQAPEGRSTPINLATLRLNVNWGLLCRQKRTLVTLAFARRSPDLEGILGLLDAIQDQAAEQLGEEQVYGGPGTASGEGRLAG